MRLLIFLFLIATISCGDVATKESAPTIDHTDVLGYWDIDSATRNGKVTSTLADSYIHFERINKLNTNLLGGDTSQSIIWTDSIAMVSDSSMSYKVNAVSVDSLHLSFSLQSHLFELLFLKHKAQKTVTSDQPL